MTNDHHPADIDEAARLIQELHQRADAVRSEDEAMADGLTEEADELAEWVSEQVASSIPDELAP